MSDFFTGVNNANFPDVVMNQVPLPTAHGLSVPRESMTWSASGPVHVGRGDIIVMKQKVV